MEEWTGIMKGSVGSPTGVGAMLGVWAEEGWLEAVEAREGAFVEVEV
jgi:hypothetical protein